MSFYEGDEVVRKSNRKVRGVVLRETHSGYDVVFEQGGVAQGVTEKNLVMKKSILDAGKRLYADEVMVRAILHAQAGAQDPTEESVKLMRDYAFSQWEEGHEEGLSSNGY